MPWCAADPPHTHLIHAGVCFCFKVLENHSLMRRTFVRVLVTRAATHCRRAKGGGAGVAGQVGMPRLPA